MFKIVPDPTFDIVVGIPIAGGDPIPLTFEVRRWTRTHLRDVTEGDISFDEVVQAGVVSWRDADVPFSKEAFDAFLEAYPLAARAIALEFLSSQTQAKQKN